MDQYRGIMDWQYHSIYLINKIPDNKHISIVRPNQEEIPSYIFLIPVRSFCTNNQSSINPILIWVYPHKQGWPDLPHANSKLSNSHSPSRWIHGILLETNTLALLLHLPLPRLLWSSSLPLALHFKFQCFSQNLPIIPPQHMVIPSHSIRLCHLNCCFLQSQHLD